MIFSKNIFVAFGVTTLSSRAWADGETCAAVESINCVPVSTAPTLDGKTEDWSSVEVFEAPLTSALVATQHYSRGAGSVKIQCSYDTERIYFLLQVPGPYRFDTDDNHLCASVSTMFKMGEDATLYNMGGCPVGDALKGDCDKEPDGCDAYKVDLGGHWELRTTEMGTYYGPNTSTGDDLEANKDDEYSVSPYCRFDDDDAKAGNEWEGAWLHSNPIDYAVVGLKPRAGSDDEGVYTFEMARSLKTASDETDAQLEPGQAIDFGVAFWDPFENNTTGWTDSGHYVTGCSKDWISLRLVDENGKLAEDYDEEEKVGDGTGAEGQDGTSAASIAHSSIIFASVAMVLNYVL